MPSLFKEPGFLIPIIHPSKSEVLAIPPELLVIPWYSPSAFVVIRVIPSLDAVFSPVVSNDVFVKLTGKASALPLIFKFKSTFCVFSFVIELSGLSLSTVVMEYVSVFSPNTSGDVLIPILRARKSSACL